MAAVVADGTIVAFASTYGVSKAMSAVSNANPAVATLEASHAVIVGDLMEVASAWPDLDGKVIRASVVATNDVTFEGFNTTSTTKFPAGAGAGSVREITAFTNIAQILTIAVEGGEPQYLDYQFLNELRQRRIPLAKSPLSITIEIADDITLAQNVALRALEAGGVPAAMRWTLPNGSVVYLNGYWSMSDLGKLTTGQIISRTVGCGVTALRSECAS